MTAWKTETYGEIILFSEFGSTAGDKINIPKSIILGWPKCLSKFFCNILWKHPNKLFGQPNVFIKQPQNIRRYIF